MTETMLLGDKQTLFSLDHSFPELPNGNIYCALTGGVESTLLLFLLQTQYHNHNIIPCTFTWSDRRQWEFHNAKRIARALNALEPIVAGHRDRFDNSNVSLPTAERYFNRENKLFDQVRKDPKFVAGFTGKNTTTLDPEIITPEAQDHFLFWFGVHRPFLKLNKAETIDIFYQLNIEHLLTLTHSCITNGESHCGSCHACYERIEAFDRLGKKDPAIYQHDYDSLVDKVRSFYARARKGTSHLL